MKCSQIQIIVTYEDRETQVEKTNHLCVDDTLTLIFLKNNVRHSADTSNQRYFAKKKVIRRFQINQLRKRMPDDAFAL